MYSNSQGQSQVVWLSERLKNKDVGPEVGIREFADFHKKAGIEMFT